MHLHGRKRWKTFKDHEKSTSFIMRTKGSCKACEEKQRKQRKTKKKVCWSAIGSDPREKLVEHLVFFMIFECFLSFTTMQTHEFAGQNTGDTNEASGF